MDCDTTKLARSLLPDFLAVDIWPETYSIFMGLSVLTIARYIDYSGLESAMADAWLALRRIVRELEKEGDLRVRLGGAYRRLVKIKPKDLPAEAREDHARLVGRLVLHPDSALAREIREMLACCDKRQLDEAKKSILRMYLLVDRYQPRARGAVATTGRSVTPTGRGMIGPDKTSSSKHAGQASARGHEGARAKSIE